MSLVGNWVPHGNDQARLTSMLAQCVLQLQGATATAAYLSAVMSQMLAGGSDYSTIETYFSLNVGTGQTLHDKLGSASSDLQGSNIQGLLQLFG